MRRIGAFRFPHTLKASAAVVLLACNAIIGIGEPTDRIAADQSSSGGASNQNTGGSSGCTGNDNPPGSHGPAMARAQRRDGTCFWVDSTEVTVAQYAEFLKQSPTGQDAVCAWNALAPDGGVAGSQGTAGGGFAPPEACAISAGIDFSNKNAIVANRPMTCIDWCDALSFCKWAGKDLCLDDGSTDPSLTKSDWVVACAGSDGTSLYGIRGTWQEGVCNGGTLGPSELQPVGAFPDCFVPSNDKQQIFDLSGNAAEWVRRCSPDTDEGYCVHRGGSFDSNDGALRCASAPSTKRMATLPTLGFRCCAESIEGSGG